MTIPFPKNLNIHYHSTTCLNFEFCLSRYFEKCGTSKYEMKNVYCHLKK